MRQGFIVVLMFVVGKVGLASAADRYVDNGCGVDGDGTTVACAAASGGAGAHTDLQVALSEATAGDVINVRAGSATYVTTNGVGYTTPTGFHFQSSGVDGQPITLRGYQNERPLLAACADGVLDAVACGRNTISIHNHNYIRVTGLRVRGVINTRCDATSAATLCPGLELDHLEITQGWSSPGDGNWSGIWVSGATGPHLHHNYIHDIALLSNAGQQSSAACIKVYTGIHGLYEQNTCDGVNVAESQSGCFDDKQDAVDNVWRYNYCVNANGGIRLQNQSGPFTGVPTDATGMRIFQNVFVLGVSAVPRDGVRMEAAGYNGIEIYNNTFVGFDTCFGTFVQDPGESALGVQMFNNICANMATRNLRAEDPAYIPARYDYNVDGTATPSPRYLLGGQNYADLAALVAGTALADNSTTADNFDFVTGGTDAIPYHLSDTSPLKGRGRVNGMPSGGAIDPGAYVDGITCVGHTCGDPAVPPPDGGVGDDAGTNESGGDGGGCCSTSRRTSHELLVTFVLIAATTFGLRRRRRQP